jgi:hypothetical protein
MMTMSIDRRLSMTSLTTALHAICLTVLGCVLVSTLAGCQGPAVRDSTGKTPPSIGELNERQSDCALELWRDDSKFALRLRKLGERFLWVGSDGSAWWVFELMSEPVRLVVLPPGETGGFSIGPGQGLLNPDRLLHLAGLLPYDGIDAETLGFDDVGRVRFVTVDEAGIGWRRTRWHLDPKTLLPDEIEALDDQGEVLATARLSAYEPIAARDLPLGAWPQFPRKVFLALSDGNTDVRLFFNRPSARGNGIRPKLFDLEQLMKTFRPGEVEYVSR